MPVKPVLPDPPVLPVWPAKWHSESPSLSRLFKMAMSRWKGYSLEHACQAGASCEARSSSTACAACELGFL